MQRSKLQLVLIPIAALAIVMLWPRAKSIESPGATAVRRAIGAARAASNLVGEPKEVASSEFAAQSRQAAMPLVELDTPQSDEQVEFEPRSKFGFDLEVVEAETEAPVPFAELYLLDLSGGLKANSQVMLRFEGFEELLRRDARRFFADAGGRAQIPGGSLHALLIGRADDLAGCEQVWYSAPMPKRLELARTANFYVHVVVDRQSALTGAVAGLPIVQWVEPLENPDFASQRVVLARTSTDAAGMARLPDLGALYSASLGADSTSDQVIIALNGLFEEPVEYRPSDDESTPQVGTIQLDAPPHGWLDVELTTASTDLSGSPLALVAMFDDGTDLFDSKRSDRPMLVRAAKLGVNRFGPVQAGQPLFVAVLAGRDEPLAYATLDAIEPGEVLGPIRLSLDEPLPNDEPVPNDESVPDGELAPPGERNKPATSPKLVGRVVDESGAPVRGVLMASTWTDDGPLQVQAETDGDGRFEFQADLGKKHVPLALRSHEHAFPNGWAMAEPGNSSVELVAVRGGTFSLQVNGLPRGATRVVFVEIDRHAEQVAPQQGRFDSTGSLAFGPLAPGKYDVRWQTPEFASALIATVDVEAGEHLDLGVIDGAEHFDVWTFDLDSSDDNPRGRIWARSVNAKGRNNVIGYYRSSEEFTVIAFGESKELTLSLPGGESRVLDLPPGRHSLAY